MFLPVSSGFNVGEGVISGVMVLKLMFGTGGAGLCAFKMLKPVLLLPRRWRGERGDAGALLRGLEGRPVKTLRGGASGRASLSSSGVGGS